MRALVIDDSAPMRAILRSVLRDAGFVCIEECADGQDALSRVGAVAPDLVLVDLDLPVVDGIAFLRAYRASGGRAPAIMVTGDASRERVVEAIDAGAASYIVKPFHPSTLRERIAQAVAIPAGAGAAA
ncbi:MAG: response regulator [Phycisphaerales bacterium]